MCKQSMLAILMLTAMAGGAMAQNEAGTPFKKTIQITGNLKMEKGTYLGIASTPASPALREQLKLKPGVGLLVDRVEKQSPAEQAGIKQYDILEKLDDQWLIMPEQMAILVRMHDPGTEVKLSIIRQGQPQVIQATLVEKELPPVNMTNGTILFKDGTSMPGVINFDGNVAEIVGPLQSGAGRMVITGPKQMTVTRQDSGVNLVISRNGDNVALKATDSAGNVLYDGPVNTEEQWSNVPADIAAKAQKIIAEMKINAPRVTTGP